MTGIWRQNETDTARREIKMSLTFIFIFILPFSPPLLFLSCRSALPQFAQSRVGDVSAAVT